MSRRLRTVLAITSGLLIVGAVALPLVPAIAIGPWVLLMMIIGFALLEGAVHGGDSVARLTEHDRHPVR